MNTTHTNKEYDSELRSVRERLTQMGGRCEEQITLAMRALEERDDELARKVIAADGAIDRDELEIDEMVLQILATRQPVASDLRFLTMSLKFVTDLERIGDNAANIAKRALELSHVPPLENTPDLGQLASLAQKNLRTALESFVARDADRAAAVIEADREIDKRNASLYAELLAHVASDPATVTRVLPLTSVCRYLERIGDHVKNLAEEIVYMVRAQDVRHRRTQKSAN